MHELHGKLNDGIFENCRYGEVVEVKPDTANETGADTGYDKTKFTIAYTANDGEPSTYEGRYDLGDNDGGLVNHIRLFGQSFIDHPAGKDSAKEGRDILAFADYLESYTANETKPSNIIPFVAPA